MAKLYQTAPIVLPDFAAIEQRASEAQFNRQMQLENYLSQFQQERGYFLPGQRGAVQETWNEVQKAMDMVSQNPRDVNARRKLREAQSYHTQVAGAAQYLAEQYRTESVFAAENPDKIAMSAEDWMSKSDAYSTTRLNSDEILGLASMGNPFKLDRVTSYQANNPSTLAAALIEKAPVGDWVNPRTGLIDEAKLSEYVDQNLNSLFGDAQTFEGGDLEEVERALVWSRNSRGFNGIPGRMSAKDLAAIRNLPPEEQAKAVQFFRDKVKETVLRDAPNYIKDTRTIRRENLADARAAASSGGALKTSKVLPVSSGSGSIVLTTPGGSSYTLSTSGEATLAKDQRGSYIDPETNESVQIHKIIKDADGTAYAVGLTKTETGLYDVGSGSKQKIYPVTTDMINSAFSTSVRPYIADAYSRLMGTSAGPRVTENSVNSQEIPKPTTPADFRATYGY